MKKLILAVVAASIGSSAFAGPLVFSNGVQLTDAQIIERTEEGNLVGNWTVEEGKLIAAADSKKPEVRRKQAVQEAKREYADNQDTKRDVRAAYAERNRMIGESIIDIPAETLAEIERWVKPFIDAQTEETQAKYIKQLTALKTVNDAREFFNEAYGTDADNVEFFAAIQPKGGDNAEAEGYAIGGATTCALKKLDDNRACGVGTGT